MTLMSTASRDVSLGDICEFRYGKSLPEALRQRGQYPVYGSNGQVGSHVAALTNGPTIIVGRKGSIGEISYSSSSCWPIDTTYYIDQSCTEQDIRWLSRALTHLRLTELNRSAAVPGLNREDAYRQRLLLPTPFEQRRIAAILDQADALRAKRRAALAQLDKMALAIFVEMFLSGSPSWPEETIANLGRSIRTGPFGSQLLHSEFVDEGIAVLGIDNAVRNQFAWAERRYITPAKYRELSRYRVFPDDVIITIMGTCGRVAIVPADIELAITTKHLCSITLDKGRCLSAYLHACLLRHPAVLHEMGISAKGAIMPGLNMGLIKSIKLPVPPLKLQAEFATRQSSLQAMRQRMAQSLGQFDSLFASLRHRAFNGEL